jgi:hypothetical protein
MAYTIGIAQTRAVEYYSSTTLEAIMKICIAKAVPRHRAPIIGLAVTAVLASMGAASAQERYPSRADQYSAIYGNPDPQNAPSRWDRARFDRSGTRGREGLGASPMRPEGPGNVSD